MKKRNIDEGLVKKQGLGEKPEGPRPPPPGAQLSVDVDKASLLPGMKIKIEKVGNGFILEFPGSKFVHTRLEEILREVAKYFLSTEESELLTKVVLRFEKEGN